MRMVRWISFLLGGDGVNAGEFENEGFVGQKIQSGKTHTIWQKCILSGKRYTLRQCEASNRKTMAGHFLSNSKYYSYYGRLTLSIVNWTQRKYGELRR